MRPTHITLLPHYCAHTTSPHQAKKNIEYARLACWGLVKGNKTNRLKCHGGYMTDSEYELQQIEQSYIDEWRAEMYEAGDE